MLTRIAAAAGLAGMAALAAWMTARSYRPGAAQRAAAGAALAPVPHFEIDDDTAAEIIRRFAPAIEAVWAPERGAV